MNFKFGRPTLGICIVAVLTACGASQSPISTPLTPSQITERPAVESFQVLHYFNGGVHDGASPRAGLKDVNGTLYGTTLEGGGSGCGYGTGCGTVFSISTSGTENIVHRFAGKADGWAPYASLTDVNGTLYGTTRYGGGSGCVEMFGCGTVYTINASGTEQVLYAFNNYANGTQPFASLINVNGKLYGTTWHGGPSSNGTVYSITKSGTEKVLHNFAGSPDGALPFANLVNVNGILYGTTWGGGSGCGPSAGCGTVYKISKTGVKKVLYSFKSGSDGANPNAGLIAVNGMLYGTTSPFVGCGSSSGGCGTVFRISTTGSEKPLHQFGEASDGSQPLAGLINVKGTLYGVTETGGAASGCSFHGGCGTVYSITTSGSENVLHNFSGADGAYPVANLNYVGGTFYGTTSEGGHECKSTGGCGTVFALTP
ncbi:MAG: choice-of-anchor tandem repeat GloVer-containing protein [Candidatus Tumulicola sp.]